MKTLRTLLILLLTAAFLCCGAAAADAKADTDARRADAIECMVTCGFLQGDGHDLGLDKALTRAEAAVLLVRLCGAEAIAAQASASPFTDVPVWAAPAVNYLCSEGAVKGISADRFGSDNPLTARDFTVMLLRTLGYRESSGDFAYTDALQFAKTIGLYDEAEYEWLLSSEYNRAAACYAAYRMLRLCPKGSTLPYVQTVVGDIRASYTGVTADIICGDNLIYNTLTDALNALRAEKNYTMTQSAVYSHTISGVAETTERTTVYRRDNRKNRSSFDVAQETIRGLRITSQHIRVYADGDAVCRSEDEGAWTVLTILPHSAVELHHDIPAHLFTPTPSLCSSAEAVRDKNGNVVITGFSSLGQLINDMTGSASCDYFYDYTIVVDPDTARILSVTVSYQDTWLWRDLPMEVSYEVEYAFSDYGSTNVLQGMTGADKTIG